MLRAQPLEIDAVHHNPARPWLFAVGGGDCVARVYDLRAWQGGGGGDLPRGAAGSAAAAGGSTGGPEARLSVSERG